MNVKELKDYLNKVEDPEGTIVVTTKDRKLVELDLVDFLYGEYVDYKTESLKTNDIFVVY